VLIYEENKHFITLHPSSLFKKKKIAPKKGCLDFGLRAYWKTQAYDDSQ